MVGYESHLLEVWLEKLKETALRSAAFQDKTSDYDKTNKTTLKNRRL